VEEDHTTKNTMQQLTLKSLLKIAHKNSRKAIVFQFFKNFMARVKYPKIEKNVENSPFEFYYLNKIFWGHSYLTKFELVPQHHLQKAR
jgi:hypothetical protein